MLAFALLALTPLALAINSNVACLAGNTVIQGQTYGAPPQSPIFGSSPCANHCAAQADLVFPDGRITYSYFSASPLRCICTTAPTSANTFMACDNTAQSTQLSLWRLRTSYAVDGVCIRYDNSSPEFTTGDLNECFNFCARQPTRFLVLSFQANLNTFACSCPPVSAFSGSNSATICASGLDQGRRFGRNVAAASRGFNRRNRAVRRVNDYCPGSLTACNVLGSVGYECIDTSSELESCGGCLHGQHGVSGSRHGARGVNCAALEEGVYGMTCKAGECVQEF